VPEQETKIVAILGSVTPPGRLRGALAGAVQHADATAGVEATLIDLAEQRVGPADGRAPEERSDDTAAVLATIAAADAVILATPVYRGSMSGSLRDLIDNVPVAALEAKPVGLVAMGATAHHFLGAERHLRDVLSFYGALVAPVAVYLTSADFADGLPTAAAASRLDDLVETVRLLAAAGLPRPLPLRPMTAR
jgi:FMN reductase